MNQAAQSTIDPVQLKSFAAACEQAVRLGGSVLMQHFGKAKSWKKGVGDWVSQADVESQHTIHQYLLDQFPSHHFLGEESPNQPSSSNSPNSEFCWIVDPLDGTVNFLHRLNSFSVSVALAVHDSGSGAYQVITGAVLDPALNELFSATLGQGAWLNGQRIQTSPCKRLADALTVVSTNTSISPTDPQVKRMLNVMATPASMRRLGSAALNLCYVACGRVDAYWAANLSCWDIAAGWLIAHEAGAVLEELDGGKLNLMRPKFCCAASPELMDELRPLMRV